MRFGNYRGAVGLFQVRAELCKHLVERNPAGHRNPQLLPDGISYNVAEVAQKSVRIKLFAVLFHKFFAAVRGK